MRKIKYLLPAVIVPATLIAGVAWSSLNLKSTTTKKNEIIAEREAQNNFKQFSNIPTPEKKDKYYKLLTEKIANYSAPALKDNIDSFFTHTTWVPVKKQGSDKWVFASGSIPKSKTWWIPYEYRNKKFSIVLVFRLQEYIAYYGIGIYTIKAGRFTLDDIVNKSYSNIKVKWNINNEIFEQALKNGDYKITIEPQFVPYDNQEYISRDTIRKNSNGTPTFVMNDGDEIDRAKSPSEKKTKIEMMSEDQFSQKI